MEKGLKQWLFLFIFSASLNLGMFLMRSLGWSSRSMLRIASTV